MKYKVCCHSGLWYLYEEGKVRREWIGEICKLSNPTGSVYAMMKAMEDGQWHTIEVSA